jgi:hypothetical protein
VTSFLTGFGDLVYGDCGFPEVSTTCAFGELLFLGRSAQEGEAESGVVLSLGELNVLCCFLKMFLKQSQDFFSRHELPFAVNQLALFRTADFPLCAVTLKGCSIAGRSFKTKIKTTVSSGEVGQGDTTPEAIVLIDSGFPSPVTLGSRS